MLRKDDITVMLQQLDGYRKPDHYPERPGGVWNVYIRTDDVRALYEQLSTRDDVDMVERLPASRTARSNS